VTLLPFARQDQAAQPSGAMIPKTEMVSNATVLGTGQSNGNLLQETSVPEEVDSIGKGKRCIVDCGGRGLAGLDG
jgi:hypothetical protein